MNASRTPPARPVSGTLMDLQDTLVAIRSGAYLCIAADESLLLAVRVKQKTCPAGEARMTTPSAPNCWTVLTHLIFTPSARASSASSGCASMRVLSYR